MGREGERVAVGLGEAAEEGEGGARGDEVVRVRVHRRRPLHRAPQLRVLGLHARSVDLLLRGRFSGGGASFDRDNPSGPVVPGMSSGSVELG